MVKSKTKNEVKLDRLYVKRDIALRRVVELWHKDQDSKMGPDNNLVQALDDLAAAHCAATFAWAREMP